MFITDFVATSTNSRFFTAFYILIGVGFAGILLGSAIEGWLENRKAVKQLRDVRFVSETMKKQQVEQSQSPIESPMHHNDEDYADDSILRESDGMFYSTYRIV